MEHCITCKKIIPDVRWEDATTPEGHRICLACKNECGLDTHGLVKHHQCPDGCMVVTYWDEMYEDSHHPMA